MKLSGTYDDDNIDDKIYGEDSDLIREDLQKLLDLTTPLKKSDEKLVLKEGERRFVTVLFMDIKGFTDLSGRMDHEFINDFTEHFFRIVRNQVERRGGWIDHYAGDAALAAFGARKAHEDDAARAIDAAFAILDTAGSLNPQLSRLGGEFGVRIGIHSGEATRGKRDESDVIMGDTVNIAARLEQNAEVNSILVSDVTRNLAADRYSFSEKSPLYAKGKKFPISNFSVEGRIRRKERWLRSSLLSVTNFVGRRRELAHLKSMYEQCFKEPSAGDPETPVRHVLLDIEAEAGMGKSRLVHEFLKSINKSGAMDSQQNKVETAPPFLKGNASHFASRPYEMVISFLLNFLNKPTIGEPIKKDFEQAMERLKKDAESSEKLDKAIPLLGRLLGLHYDDPRFQALDPMSLRTEIVIAFRTFMETLAQRNHHYGKRPFIMIWEDYHWADDPSKEALRFLLSSAKTFLPLMIILPHRPGVELPEVMKTRVKTGTLKLKPLTRDDEILMIQSMLGGIETPEELLTILRGRTEGNPFFVEELIQHFMDTGIIVRTREGWKFRSREELGRIPATLQNLALERIDLLEEPEKNILQRASVYGRDFSHGILQWIEQKLEGNTDLKEALDMLESLNFIIKTTETADSVSSKTDAYPSSGSMKNAVPASAAYDEKTQLYTFRHAIIREAAYNTLLHSNLRILHRICAEGLEHFFSEDMEPHCRDIAEHWLRAGNDAKAADYFQRAGRQALSSYDHKSALYSFTRADEIINDDDPQKIGILLARGEAYARLGKTAEAMLDFEESLASAKRADDATGEADALDRLGTMHFSQGKIEEAHECYQKSLELRQSISDHTGIGKSLNNIGNIHYSQGRCDKASEFYLESIEVRKRINDMNGAADAMNNMGLIHKSRGRYDEALEYFQEALEIKKKSKDRRNEANLLLNMGILHFNKAEYSKAMEYFENSLVLSSETGNLQGETRSLNSLGNTYCRTGNFEEALKYFRRSLELRKEIRDRAGIVASNLNIGNIMYLQGMNHQALPYFQKALIMSRELGSIKREAEVLNNVGMIHYKDGRYDISSQCMKRSLLRHQELDNKTGVCGAVLNIGKLHFAGGEWKQALLKYEEALKISREINFRSNEAFCLNNIGEIHLFQGEYEQGQDYFNEALNIFKELKEKKGRYIVLANLGKTLLRKGQFEKALELYAQSRNLRKKVGNRRSEAYIISALGDVRFSMNQLEQAEALYQKSLKMKREIEDFHGEGHSLIKSGILFYVGKQYAEAADCFRKSVILLSETEQEYMIMMAKSMLARLLHLTGEKNKARNMSQKTAEWLKINESKWSAALPDIGQIYFTRFLVLKEEDQEKARKYLNKAYQILKGHTDRIKEPDGRLNVLNAPLNRLVIEEWKKQF